MRYIPSEEIKEKEIKPDNLAKKSWAVKTGFLPDIFKKYGAVKLGRALDIGSGAGSTGIFLHQYFNKVYGVDLASYLADEAKKIVDFSKADLNFDKLPYQDGFFDVATSFQVFEHLENPFFAMREVSRVLRPGGLFLMSVPNPFQWTFKLKFLLTGNMPPYTEKNNHLLFLTRDVFKKTFLANFDLVDIIYQKGDIPFYGRLRLVFGGLIKYRHYKALPRNELFARCVCYVLEKK